MARMINCAADYTYDMFVADAKKYKANPRKGVHCSRNADFRERFMTWLKDYVRDFRAEWGDCDYTNEWIGDAFARELRYSGFSDYYKDAYNQRPHLDMWFYITQLDLPMREDTARTFCAHPVENAIADAVEVREMLMSM